MFTNDLKRGQLAENQLCTLLTSAGFCCEIDGKDVDVRVTGHGCVTSAEVKFDEMASRTGNIAVEYHNCKQDKPSGLLATKAELWVIAIGSPVNLWICRTDTFRRYVAENKPHRDLKKVGDGNASIWLFKTEQLVSDLLHKVEGFLPRLISELSVGKI